MGAVFVVGSLDVHVQPSGETRFFLTGISRFSGQQTPLGVARWEPGDRAFSLSLTGGGALFPEGSSLMDTLVTRLDAVRTWYQSHEPPDPHLGIILGDNTASR